MYLQGDHTARRRFVGLLVDDFHRHGVVDEMLQVISIGDDPKVIPLTGVNSGSQCFRFAKLIDVLRTV